MLARPRCHASPAPLPSLPLSSPTAGSVVGREAGPQRGRPPGAPAPELQQPAGAHAVREPDGPQPQQRAQQPGKRAPSLLAQQQRVCTRAAPCAAVFALRRLSGAGPLAMLLRYMTRSSGRRAAATGVSVVACGR